MGDFAQVRIERDRFLVRDGSPLLDPLAHFGGELGVRQRRLALIFASLKV
jgi:hypothetical protein